MEEYVGKLWHRFITNKAERSYPEAAVCLDEVRSTVGILFRALGGDPGLQVQPADATAHNARRRFLQKLAGTGTHASLAWRDGETLRLPPRVAAFPERERNRDLYLWLAALAAGDEGYWREEPWAGRSQRLVRRALTEYPGFAARYRALVESHIATRPVPQRLSPDEAAQELAVRQALRAPGTVDALPPARRPPHPVPLWLHPSPPACAPAPASDDEPEGTQDPSAATEETGRKRHRAERVDMPEGEEGLLAVRMETILTWGEYVKVDRAADDDPDDNAAQAADDMEQLSVARDSSPVSKRLRFDLDMPSAEYDDLPLEGGALLPEWDHRKASYLADHCRIVPMVARDATACELPQNLRRTAKRLRGQFQALAQTRVWQRGAEQGDPDIDAYLRFAADRSHGHVAAEAALYRELRTGARDLACLLLADLSLSTDAAVNDDDRVIDVVRDTLFLFGEALAAAGDRFALYGFSSRKRQHVRFNLIKGFDERYDAAARGRIAAIKPGYYTRMGAAVRHATSLLAAQPATRQLLLIVTDGKPNDLDCYEGRYGVEDTRIAIIEARRQGLQPYCVTIDREAGDYLPHLFGPGHYCVIRHPEELPARLPQLYARLTA